MTIEEFYNHFEEELRINTKLRSYYRFLNDLTPSIYNFRKRYFIQRLNYIDKQITEKNSNIWDCGCGYGTTAIFLALNGHKVYGNTLEFYFEPIEERLKYWKQFGNLDNLELSYTNHFDIIPQPKFNYVIVQDTIHHLEPIETAIEIISKSLLKGGKLIAIEVNGSNIIERFRYFLQRGNKTVIELYDEKLEKTIYLGNENIRPLKKWQKLLLKGSIKTDTNTIEYIRFFLPIFYKVFTLSKIEIWEGKWWKKYPLIKKYLYFGLNFTSIKE